MYPIMANNREYLRPLAVIAVRPGINTTNPLWMRFGRATYRSHSGLIALDMDARKVSRGSRGCRGSRGGRGSRGCRGSNHNSSRDCIVEVLSIQYTK